MPLTREERKLIHQKAKQPTFGSGKPDVNEGNEGDIAFRKVQGSGTVQYVKESGSWKAIGSSGEMPQIRIIGSSSSGDSSGGGGGISNHSDLSGLNNDDHAQYVLVDGSRSMTGDLSLGGGDGALQFTTEGENSIKIPDNQANALIIEESNTAYLTFVTTNSGEKITLGKKLEAGSVEIEGSLFDINGGAIDGTTIGASSASSGIFTTLESTGNTTLGDAAADSLTINAETINTPNIAAGTDDTVVVYNGSTLVTDEIDSRVWGSTLVDATNGTDSRIAIFTDSNSVEGDSNLTFTTDGLIVAGNNISVGSASTPDRLSDMITSDQEVFFGSILNSGNSKFTFAGNNGDGTTTLADNDGFGLTNSTFVSSSNIGKITNTASAQGFASLSLTTVVNKIYNISFDVTGGDSEIEMCLSTHNTNWNPSSQTGNRSTGTGHTLVDSFTATGTTSYLLIRLISSTSSEYADIDNLVVQEETTYTGGEIGSPNFSSGFAGSGWKFDLGGTAENEFDLTVDNMYVRGTLNVYELLIQQIRATNGAVFVTSAAKVASTTNLSDGDSDGDIVFEDPSGNKLCPFAANDLIMMQRIVPGSLAAGTSSAGSINVIKKLVYQVNSVSGSTATVTSASGFTNTTYPSKGDDFVRIGNTSDADRRGIIYLTSDDANAPYIDIKDGCNTYAAWNATSTTKARLGKLSGITHNSASLSGYGLYSQNVYLTGDITATTGYIGGTSGWTIGTNKLSSTYNSNIIGLVQQASAHADVGSVSAFYAGATADTGQGASISFGSDGKIRGNGIYRRGSVDYLITTSRIFGNGSDGALTISSSSLSEDENDAGTDLGDNWITSGALQRDIYCTNLTINSGITCNTNGYRIFVRDTLTIGGSGAKFYNNGSNGDDGSHGASDMGGGDGGSGSGAGGAEGSLRGGIAGGNGGNGGEGGSGSGADGAAGTQGNNTSNVVASYTNSSGARGGDGAGLGSGGIGGSGVAGGASSTASDGAISITNSDLTYIIAMRDIFAIGNSAPSLYPATGASGGGGGGGGDEYGGKEGKGGGGGGQAGGSGGHVMVIARIIAGNLTHLELEAKGGNGGGGGNQSSTSGQTGGVGGGGNGGDGGCVTLISGTDPSDVVIDVAGGSAGTNGSTGGVNNAGTPAAGATGTSIVINC